MISETRRRLFIGVAYSPSPQVVEFIEELDRLAEDSMPGLRTTRLPNLHVTLRFLGQQPASDLPVICQVMAQSLAGLASREPGLRGLGLFRQALWLGVEPEGALDELVASLNRSLAVAGFPGDGKPFTPHLTVARLPGSTHPQLAELRNRYAEQYWGPLPVDSIALFESQALPDGVRYEVIYQVPLLGTGRTDPTS